LHCGDTRAVIVAMNFGILYEFARINLLFDGIYCGEIVVYSVLLSLTWLPRSMTDTELYILFFAKIEKTQI